MTFLLRSVGLFQMSLHNIQSLYRRVEEMPFNSDTKYMSVKCTPKYGRVSENTTGSLNTVGWEFTLQKQPQISGSISEDGSRSLELFW